MRWSAVLIAFVSLDCCASNSNPDEAACLQAAAPARPGFDARTRIELPSLRLCGFPMQKTDVAESADVVVWEVGDAAWARAAAMHQPGAVIVARKTSGTWDVTKRLLAPEPAAYDGFGVRLASDGVWVAVMTRRTRRVWVFELGNLDKPGQEIAGVNGFARAIAAYGNDLIVGGDGEARIYRKDASWNLVERIPAPSGAPDAFSGDIAASGDLVAATTSGVNTGDGIALPGRVDVFRRTSSGWQWEGRLSPNATESPFGQDCCVSVAKGQVLVMMGEAHWKFINDGQAWRLAPGSVP